MSERIGGEDFIEAMGEEAFDSIADERERGFALRHPPCYKCEDDPEGKNHVCQKGWPVEERAS